MDSIELQTYKDYEIVITEDGKMAENTNSAIDKSNGDIIKILYMDDFLAHPNALQNIVDAWSDSTKWLVTGCNHLPGTHTHLPTWNDRIVDGVNTIGSPSVLAISKNNDVRFDENLTWVLDCDLYQRMKDKYGPPTILNDINVTIGLHDGQTTMTLPEEIKQKEYQYIHEKHTTK